MNRPSYPFDRRQATRYSFVSKGSKGTILKVVQLKPTSARGIYNLSFGDLQQDGTIDDTINTNNNDIMIVMATIVSIVYDFTSENPGAKIVFAGNSQARMALYFRILKTYYSEFSKTLRKKKIVISYYVSN